MKKIFIIILGIAGILVVYVASAKKSFRYPIVVNSINNIIPLATKETENNKSSTKTFQANERKWQLIDDKFWQIVAEIPGEPKEITDEREGNRGNCPAGMVSVEGRMKFDPTPNTIADNIDWLQRKTCVEWINREYPERCKRYDRDEWLRISAPLPTKSMKFCIDRYEYPGIKGEYPLIYVNFDEAEQLCEKEGKRLCTEEEWTFACEGSEAKPYPYGYERDSSVEHGCNIDKKWRPYHPSAYRQRDGIDLMYELDYLWQGESSGSRLGCRSDFGVMDLSSNVDEWSTKVYNRGKYKSILKGGYFGPVRTRCRPSTRSHGSNHTFYQQSFRCCFSDK